MKPNETNPLFRLKVLKDTSPTAKQTFSEELFETAVKIICLQGEQILKASPSGKFPHS